MTKLLRSLFAIAVLTTAVGIQAARADDPNIKGNFIVSLAVAAGQAPCGTGNVAVEAHGLGQTAQGPMFLTVKKCFYPADTPPSYAGTFALCPSDSLCGPDSQDALSGTYAGVADP